MRMAHFHPSQIKLYFTRRSFLKQRLLSCQQYDESDFAKNGQTPEAQKFFRFLQSTERVSALAQVQKPKVVMLEKALNGDDCQIGMPNGDGMARIYYSARLADIFRDGVLDAITAHEIAHFKGIKSHSKGDAYAAKLMGSAKGLMEYFQFKIEEHLKEVPRGFVHRCIVAVNTGSQEWMPKHALGRLAARLIFAIESGHPPLVKRIRALERLEKEIA